VGEERGKAEKKKAVGLVAVKKIGKCKKETAAR
jgi:hypothetical protein